MKKIIAKDTEHLEKIILQTIKKEGDHCDLNFIDTSKIDDMSYLFKESSFNGNISRWNTSNVLNMDGMFFKAEFNNDISGWDTSKVKNMSRLFYLSKFRGDISNWNIYNTKYITYIFTGCYSKNIPYWAEIDDFKERQQAYLRHMAEKEKNMIKNNMPKKVGNKNADTFKI